METYKCKLLRTEKFKAEGDLSDDIIFADKDKNYDSFNEPGVYCYYVG